MSKYSPLGDYLRNQHHRPEVPLSFAEIEQITGVKLPTKAQLHRAWWSNNPSNNVMTKVWLEAGYETSQVDMSARKLLFRRRGQGNKTPGPSTRSPAADATPSAGVRSERHPLFGALKGLLRVARGTDLTKPADPDWGKRA